MREGETMEGIKFEDMGLSSEILKAVKYMGCAEETEAVRQCL